MPETFVFAIKAPRAASHGRDPAKVAASIAYFLASGITELGPKLGPILWQFPANRSFDPAWVAQFLSLLPPSHAGCALRHAIEAKHPTFADPSYAALLRQHGVAECIVEHGIAKTRTVPTTDFLYLRLQRTELDSTEGYDSGALDRWSDWLHANIASMSRGVHVYFISGAKERAPDAACALLARFGFDPDAVSDRDLRPA